MIAPIRVIERDETGAKELISTRLQRGMCGSMLGTIDVLDEYGLSSDWTGEAEVHEKLYLNRTYTDGEFRCGASYEVAGSLIEAGATFQCWEDPKYEYLGDYHANVPGVGYISGECDADGNMVVSDHNLREMIQTASDLDELKERVEKLFGTPVQDAIRELAKSLEGRENIEVELAPLEEEARL